MFWTKARAHPAPAPVATPLKLQQSAEAELLPALAQLEQLRTQMLAEIAVYTKQFYEDKAGQTAVAFPDHTRTLGPRLTDLKADVRALQDGAARAVVERLGHPVLWLQNDLTDPDWWWRDDYDCDYETGDADRELRDRLYQVFGRLQPVLQKYGYQPDWRRVGIDNRRALFGQPSFQEVLGEYRVLLAKSRHLRRTVDVVRRQQARLEAERLWQEA